MIWLAQKAMQERSSVSSTPIPLPPPLKGMYAKDASSRTSPEYGLQLTNLMSDGVLVQNRPRSGPTTGFPSNCYQAWDYEFGGSRKAVFRTSTGLASDNGATTEAVSYSGDIMAAEISSRLAFVGGGASARLWDGTSFSTPTWTMPSSITLSDMTGIVTHHDRIYLWNENADDAEFFHAEQVSALDPITFVRFPLYALGNIKGRVKAMVSLTIDAGHGSNDVLAIIMTTGQVVVYEGLDPSDPTDWRIWGRVPGLSDAVSANAVVHIGVDALIATRGGVVSLMSLLQTGAEAVVTSASDAIDGDLRETIEAGLAFRGWQMIHDPKGEFMILNYPTAADAYAQWVYVYASKGWFQWTVPARWWFSRDGSLYFIDTSGDVRSFGASNADEPAMTMTWWTTWQMLSPRDTQIQRATLDLMSKSAASLSVVCLTDNRATSAAITENTQTVSLPLQDEASSDFQNLDEVFFLNQIGRVVQLRFSLSATEAKWHGITLNA